MILRVVNIIVLSTLIILVYPLIFIALYIVYLAFDAFGFWGVYRLIPEWIKVYGIAMASYVLLQIIQFLFQLLVGQQSIAGIIIFLIFTVGFQTLFLLSLRTLYNYAMRCKVAAGGAGVY
ncbi:hypothetical protein HK102_002993 [Quaeritorhiza haematococci]|nr:hypothetical protein HK102_002993 [Quaeritorhiza haematococci]